MSSVIFMPIWVGNILIGIRFLAYLGILAAIYHYVLNEQEVMELTLKKKIFRWTMILIWLAVHIFFQTWGGLLLGVFFGIFSYSVVTFIVKRRQKKLKKDQ